MVRLTCLAALLFATLATGCAYLLHPKNASQMRETQKEGATVCSPLLVTEAVDRVEAAWRRCHVRQYGSGSQAVVAGGATVLIPYGNTTPFLRKEQDGDTTLILFGQPQNGNVLMTAEVRKTEACSAQVVARGWNFVWHARASNVSRHLKDPAAECP